MQPDEKAPDAQTKAAPEHKIVKRVSIGGPAPEMSPATLTVEDFARALGRKGKTAGFLAAERGRQPLRRTAADWKEALAAFLRQPVR